jgi:hypothetical protein
MRRFLLAVAALTLVAGFAAPSRAQPHTYPNQAYPDQNYPNPYAYPHRYPGPRGVPGAAPRGVPRVVQIPQGVGCYWYRHRLNCSRYCYWEIDGQRYCTRHAREAESQAPGLYYDEGPPPPYRGRGSVK